MDLGPEYVALGAALKRLRQAATLTQVEAGAAVKISGASVSMAERGERGLRWGTLLRLLAAYDADLARLAAEIEQR